jgi:PAS domain S-box-containing protein
MVETVQSPAAISAEPDRPARREAESSALRDIEARFRATFEQAAVGMAHVGLDGRWLAVNRRLSEIVGYTADELRELNFQAITHPDDLDADLANVAALLAGEIETYAMEKRYLRKDRSIVWINLTVSLVRDIAGSPQYFIAVVEDIEKRKRAETAQAQLAAIVASSDDAIIGRALDGTVTSWNRGAENLFGYAEAEMIGEPIARIVPQDKRDEEAYILEQLRAGRTVAHLETQRCRRDGTLLDVSVTVSPIRDANGGLVGASKIVRDVTDRKRTENALRESEAKYRLLFENMTEEVRLWKLHRNERGEIETWSLVDANPPVLRSWDKSIGEVIGKTPAEIFGSESLHIYRPVVEKILASGKPHSFEAYLPTVGKHFKFTAVPLGELFITTGVDITSQKNAAENLRRLNEELEHRVAERTAEIHALWADRSRLASIVENAPDLIGIRDANFDSVYLNPAGKRLVGVESDEEARSRRPEEYFALEDRERFVQEIVPALIARGGWAGEVTMQNLRTHERIPVLYNVFRIEQAAAGMPGYSAAIVRDLRARKRLEAQLLQAQKMEAVGQLTGGIAHDFNNLLTAIAGSFELIERGAGNPARVRQMVASGLHAVDRGARLTSSLLAFSRKQRLESEIVDVNAQIRVIEPLLRQAAGELNRLEFALQTDLDCCEADVAQLETAVLNLVINARDAMPGGGRLVISTRDRVLTADDLHENREASPGRFVAIIVEDSGEGIPPQTLKRVFEPFFTTKEVGKGSGLGLSQVYGFAHQLGGHVEIQSGVGEGTRVTIYLPAAQAPAAASGLTAGQASGLAKPLTVLLVEDDELVRTTTREALEEAGCQVIDARDGAEALAILRSDQALDLLFTDVIMPEIDGVELARATTQLRPDLKVLLTSGYADAVVDLDPEGERVTVLMKPYRRADLERRIAEIFGHQKS